MASPQSRRCSPRSQRSPGRVRGSSGGGGRLVGEGGGRARSGEEVVDLALLEAGQVEVEAEQPEVGDLGGEQALVPAGVQRELVVGQQVGPLLGLAQARTAR